MHRIAELWRCTKRIGSVGHPVYDLHLAAEDCGDIERDYRAPRAVEQAGLYISPTPPQGRTWAAEGGHGG